MPRKARARLSRSKPSGERQSLEGNRPELLDPRFGSRRAMANVIGGRYHWPASSPPRCEVSRGTPGGPEEADLTGRPAPVLSEPPVEVDLPSDLAAYLPLVRRLRDAP